MNSLRRTARINAIRTASQNARSYGEEGSSAEDHQMTEQEYELFIEECKKLADFLDKKANKLQFG